MDNYKLYIFLSFVFTFSLIFDFLKFSEQKTAIDIVNDMGIGYNLGNTFDCYDSKIKIENPDDQITLYKNPIPTQNLILRLKKYGFKTIRIPITWINFIDEKGNINSKWLYRIKEVVNWIINAQMYCIINTQDDGELGNWLSEGLESKDIYINLWTQIANEFKDYDEHLIFESMNQPQFYSHYFTYDYKTLLILSQAFVDTIRNSDNMNKQRLLIISGASADLELSTYEDFKLPVDPVNKTALSLHYYNPHNFVFDPAPTDDISLYKDYLTWGNDNDYQELFTDFNLIKSSFLDKNIPVIITATGVLTEEKKEKKSIREYLYTVFSLSNEYNGMMTCLWDSSKSKNNTNYYPNYNMNYYNREKDIWFDKKIQNNFLQISKGKYMKMSEYYIKSNKEIFIEPNHDDDYLIKLGNRKPLKIIFNAKIKGQYFQDSKVIFTCYNTSNLLNEFIIEKKYLKKEYDGTSTFTFDISDKNCFYDIRLYKYNGGNDNFIFNNLTVEFQDSFLYFDYKSYKNDLENYIN